MNRTVIGLAAALNCMDVKLNVKSIFKLAGKKATVIRVFVYPA